MDDWTRLAGELTEALTLNHPPIAITFHAHVPADLDAFDAPMPPPTADGRTGRVAAGCVFWTHALDRTFSTVAADHGNCSVGSVTHGFGPLTRSRATPTWPRCSTRGGSRPGWCPRSRPCGRGRER